MSNSQYLAKDHNQNGINISQSVKRNMIHNNKQNDRFIKLYKIIK